VKKIFAALIVMGVSMHLAHAADNVSAKEYAERYAKANSLELVWNISTDYLVKDAAETYMPKDLTHVLFQASQMRTDGQGTLNDKLLAAVVCNNKKTLVVEPLSQARQRMGQGCDIHNP
jgi:hypothetical protein